jgi:hypothetical protein
MGGQLRATEICSILSKRKKKHGPRVFVETGTYMADTTITASYIFEDVFSVEINKVLYEKATEKCSNRTNIHLTLGDSVQWLSNVLPTLKHKGVVLFLDAHQSGHDTSNNGKWVPLLEELAVIAKQLKNTTGHILIIDDVRLFSKHWDWEGVSIDTIHKCIEKEGMTPLHSEVVNDRLIIYI